VRAFGALALGALAAAATAAPAAAAGKIAYEGSCGGAIGICVLPDDGSAPAALVVGSAGQPRWSPDGGRLVFTTANQVGLANADGTGLQLLTSDGTATRPNTAAVWSPDAAQIVFTNAGQIQLMNADGTGRHSLFPGSSARDSRPLFSADGKRVLFVRASKGTSDFYSARGDGSGLHRLTIGGVLGPAAASPDGRRYAFAARRPGLVRSEIWVASTEGAAPRRVSPVGVWKLPAWSSDGAGLLADRGQSSYRLSLTGGPTAPLGTALTRPDWWVEARAPDPGADDDPPKIVVFSGPPVAASSARAQAAVTRLVAGPPRRTIVSRRTRLRIAILDRSGIAHFRLSFIYGGERCRRTGPSIGDPVRCVVPAEILARSAAELRSLPRRLKPGPYGLFVQATDVLGNAIGFPAQGALRITR
jgi:dipeptidyl aminopeptidase/acylaminoacyl peptidase